MDRALHWVILALVNIFPDSWTSWSYRWFLTKLLPRGWRVVDRSDRQLTMEHYLFRHIETEMFVRQSDLAEMIQFTQWFLQWCAGDPQTDEAGSASVSRWMPAVDDVGLPGEWKVLKGRYRHHYPICIRKVLPDQRLVSMTSGGDQPWYAVSFISYHSPNQRAGFLGFSQLLVKVTGQLFGARPHWGKHTQLPPPDVDKLYLGWEAFLELRDAMDPTEAFSWPWCESARATEGVG